MTSAMKMSSRGEFKAYRVLMNSKRAFSRKNGFSKYRYENAATRIVNAICSSGPS